MIVVQVPKKFITAFCPKKPILNKNAFSPVKNDKKLFRVCQLIKILLCNCELCILQQPWNTQLQFSQLQISQLWFFFLKSIKNGFQKLTLAQLKKCFFL